MGFLYNQKRQNESANRQNVIDSLSRENKELNGQIVDITSRLEVVVNSVEKLTLKIDGTTISNEKISTENLVISTENKNISKDLKIITDEIKEITSENTSLTKENLAQSIAIRNNSEADAYFERLNLSAVNKDLNGGYYIILQNSNSQAQYRKAHFREGDFHENLEIKLNPLSGALSIVVIDESNNKRKVSFLNSLVANNVKMLRSLKQKIRISPFGRDSMCSYFILIERNKDWYTYAVGYGDCE